MNGATYVADCDSSIPDAPEYGSIRRISARDFVYKQAAILPDSTPPVEYEYTPLRVAGTRPENERARCTPPQTCTVRGVRAERREKHDSRSQLVSPEVS